MAQYTSGPVRSGPQAGEQTYGHQHIEESAGPLSQEGLGGTVVPWVGQARHDQGGQDEQLHKGQQVLDLDPHPQAGPNS